MKRNPNHYRVELRSAGERKRSENCWTFVCSCGKEESARTKAETLREWNAHIKYENQKEKANG